MKHLPKHLQPRWRYLAVEIESWPDADFGRSDFQRQLWYSAQNLLGDADSGRLDLSVMQFTFEDGAGHAVVRTRRGCIEDARAAVACIDRIGGSTVGLRVRKTSGTVRACEEKYMGHAPEDPEQRHVVFGDAERSGFVRRGRVDIEIGEAYTGATILDIN